MSISSTIANSPYAVQTPATTTGNSTSNNKLNMQNFLVLLTKELANQDPTQPMDDSSFFTQIAQINSAEGMDNLNNNSQVQMAQSLMGQVVTATNPSLTGSVTEPTITGTVGRLTVKDGVYYLGIQDTSGNYTDVTMDSIQSILPGNSLSNPSQLIGAYVSGPQTSSSTSSSSSSTTVTGQVVGLTVVSGKTLLEVKESSGTTVTMDPTQVTNVATSAAGS